jgi:cytochrome P450
VYSRLFRQWFVFGYDEVNEVLRSPHTATARVADLMLSTRQYRKLTPSTRTNFSRWLLATDRPDHARLRSAVSRAFTPKQIAVYEQLVRNTVDELLAALPRSGEVDIVEAFTNKLPIQVIAELLGLPMAKREWLLQTSHEIGAILEPMTTFDPELLSGRFAELDDCFLDLIEQRRRHPGNDLISAVAIADDGPSLDDDEIVAMITFLLFAGHETVTGMLGNSLVALEANPDQRDLLHAQPELIDNAIEELLRFDAPLQMSGRQATADLCIGGVAIPQGANIAVMIGAANRDTRRWPTQTSFDSTGPTRNRSRSDSGRTIASAPRWHGWSSDWPCRRCSTYSATTRAMQAARTGNVQWGCADPSRSRSHPVRGATQHQ